MEGLVEHNVFLLGAELNISEFCAVAGEVSMTSRRFLGSPFQKENSQ